MQIVPGNAFQNTVGGGAGVPQAPPQPASDHHQTRAPVHAVKGAGQPHQILDAAQKAPQNTAPQQLPQSGGGNPAEARPNAPRGSFIDIMV